MRQMITLAAVVCVVAAVAGAQAPGAAGVYAADVVGQNIYVRSGPSATAYHCVQVAAPSRVTVVGKSGTWLKILPPKGCYSVVSKRSVAVDADGKKGKIVGENVWARAGGFPTEPDEFSMLQKALAADQPVMIVGQTGNYYKIVPPSGAYFWIAAESVKRVAGETTPVGPMPKPTTKPVAKPTTRPVVPKIDTRPHPDIVALGAIDKDLRLEYRKPAKDRDYETILARYKALKPAKDSGAEPHIAARVTLLEIEITRQADAAKVADVVAKTTTDYQDFEIAWAKIGTGAGAGAEVAFTAKGTVVPSAIYSSAKSIIGKRYLLRDDKIIRINGYILNTDGQVNLAQYVGKMVEVYGRSGYDRDLGMDLIDVQKVVVMSEAGGFPDPPAPTVGPAKTQD